MLYFFSAQEYNSSLCMFLHVTEGLGCIKCSILPQPGLNLDYQV